MPLPGRRAPSRVRGFGKTIGDIFGIFFEGGIRKRKPPQ
tara:strand:- start:7868 stop:7984 length:117 start_codon:yes stop_codon:yes gene_type:complete